jgi:hypothetical protein
MGAVIDARSLFEERRSGIVHTPYGTGYLLSAYAPDDIVILDGCLIPPGMAGNLPCDVEPHYEP